MDAAAGRRSLEELLEDARARIERLQPAEALAASEQGALVIDIRSDSERERDGIVPGSLHVPRTVLEWRLDPESAWRNPHVGGFEQRIVLLCDHGFSSVLAAATLVDLGFTRAADVVGGFAAWREAGLPVAPAPSRRGADELPGCVRRIARPRRASVAPSTLLHSRRTSSARHCKDAESAPIDPQVAGGSGASSSPV